MKLFSWSDLCIFCGRTYFVEFLTDADRVRYESIWPEKFECSCGLTEVADGEVPP